MIYYKNYPTVNLSIVEFIDISKNNINFYFDSNVINWKFKTKEERDNVLRLIRKIGHDLEDIQNEEETLNELKGFHKTIRNSYNKQ